MATVLPNYWHKKDFLDAESFSFTACSESELKGSLVVALACGCSVRASIGLQEGDAGFFLFGSFARFGVCSWRDTGGVL